MFSPLRPNLTYDRAAIMRSAWAQARADLINNTRYGVPCTLRSCFANALRSKWDLARGIKANILWQAERDAEKARRLTLPPVEREVLDLRGAREIARHIDSFAEMTRTVAEIDARLAQITA